MRKMFTVRCTQCGKEIVSQPGKTKSCGCPNMMTVNEDVVTAIDLTRTIMVKSNSNIKETNALSASDLAYQEQRRKRKVRKLDFEIR